MFILGLLAALLLFMQQPLTQYLGEEQPGIELNASNSQDDAKEQNTQDSFDVLTYEVLVPVMNFNLFHSFDLLVELPTLENTGSELVENTILVFDSFFDKLFNRIIAPNAP